MACRVQAGLTRTSDLDQPVPPSRTQRLEADDRPPWPAVFKPLTRTSDLDLPASPSRTQRPSADELPPWPAVFKPD